MRHLNRIALIVSCRASHRLLRSASAEDVAHDVAIRALSQGGKFRYGGERAFIRWIASITRSVILDRERALAAQPEIDRIRGAGSTISGPTESNIPDSVTTPSSVAACAERSARVREALMRLKGSERDVVCAVYFEGQSATECAAELGCAERTVSYRLGRGLHHLAGMLRGDLP